MKKELLEKVLSIPIVKLIDRAVRMRTDYYVGDEATAHFVEGYSGKGPWGRGRQTHSGFFKNRISPLQHLATDFHMRFLDKWGPKTPRPATFDPGSSPRKIRFLKAFERDIKVLRTLSEMSLNNSETTTKDARVGLELPLLLYNLGVVVCGALTSIYGVGLLGDIFIPKTLDLGDFFSQGSRLGYEIAIGACAATAAVLRALAHSEINQHKALNRWERHVKAEETKASIRE